MVTADNGYIDFALQFGLAGMLLLVLLIANALQDFYRILRSGRTPQAAFLVHGVCDRGRVGKLQRLLFLHTERRRTTVLVALACVGLAAGTALRRRARQGARMIYHVLPEAECFSEFRGGAMSRWTAKVLASEPETHIVCSSADDTWGLCAGTHPPGSTAAALPGFSRPAVLPATGQRAYSAAPLRRRPSGLPAGATWSGSTGCPALAESIAAAVKQAGARLVFHLQSSAFAQHSALVLRRLIKTGRPHRFLQQFHRRRGLRPASPNCPGQTRSGVIYNGADEEMFHPATRTDAQIPEVLYVGRLVPEKGVHRLLEAMQLLESRGLEVRASVIGAHYFADPNISPYMLSLRTIAPANVAFEGYVAGEGARGAVFERRISSAVRPCGMSPSAMVNVEAMAAAIPVVATAVGRDPRNLRRGAERGSCPPTMQSLLPMRWSIS